MIGPEANKNRTRFSTGPPTEILTPPPPIHHQSTPPTHPQQRRRRRCERATHAAHAALHWGKMMLAGTRGGTGRTLLRSANRGGRVTPAAESALRHALSSQARARAGRDGRLRGAGAGPGDGIVEVGRVELGLHLQDRKGDNDDVESAEGRGCRSSRAKRK